MVINHITICIVFKRITHMNIQIFKWLTMQVFTLCLKGLIHMNIQIFEWLITFLAPALESPNVSCSCSVHGRANQHVPDAVHTSASRLEHAWETGGGGKRRRKGREKKRRREERGLKWISLFYLCNKYHQSC